MFLKCTIYFKVVKTQNCSLSQRSRYASMMSDAQWRIVYVAKQDLAQRPGREERPA